MPLSLAQKLSNLKKRHYGAIKGHARALVRRGLNHAYSRVKSHAHHYVNSGGAMRDFKKYAPALAKDFTGMGRYHVGRDIGGKMGGHRVKHHKYASHGAIEKGTMRLSHTEYIADISSPSTNGAFGTTNGPQGNLYGLNAANQQTFPFLSNIAQNFQNYKFKKLIFELRPLVSDSSSTTTGTLLTMGAVIMATQYDSVLGGYLNKQQMENSDYSISAKPSKHMMHAIECNPKFNPLGVFYCSDQQNLTSGINGSDIRMQNIGILQVASSGIQTNNSPITFGELFVHYEVELYKPIIGYQTNFASCHYNGQYLYGTNTTLGKIGFYYNANTPFGGSASLTAAPPVQPTAQPGSNLNLTFTPNSFTFPPSVITGSYLMTYSLIIDAGSATGQEFSYNENTNVSTNIVYVAGHNLLAVYGSATSTDQKVCMVGPTTTATGDTQVIITCIISIVETGTFPVVVTFNTTALCTGPLTLAQTNGAGVFDLMVTPYNINIVT